jgi:predicted nucleotidyltransferase
MKNATDRIDLAASVVLPEGFLEELLSELDGEDVVGIGLGGSFARGTATALSDVDLALVVREEAQVRPKRYFYHRGLLVSVAVKSIESVRADMKNPLRATRVVPGISEVKVLVNREGALADLMEELDHFTWESLDEKANRWVSYEMMALSEPVQKVANELVKGNAPGLAYAVNKLLGFLTTVITVHKGIMVKSDSSYYQQAYEAVGEGSEWTKCHRCAAGLTEVGLTERAKACLLLYQLTLNIVKPVMSEEQLQVAEAAAHRVSFMLV